MRGVGLWEQNAELLYKKLPRDFALVLVGLFMHHWRNMPAIESARLNSVYNSVLRASRSVSQAVLEVL